MDNKFTKILFIVWCALAVASFTTSFFIPLIPKIINIAFGAVNFVIIGSVLADYINTKKELRRQKKLLKGKKEE